MGACAPTIQIQYVGQCKCMQQIHASTFYLYFIISSAAGAYVNFHLILEDI